MIVHTPEIKRIGGEISIVAPIEMSSPLPYLPSELWYRFPIAYEAYLKPRADAFAATALLVSMYCGEDLLIRGPISPKLAKGLLDFRGVFHAWLPKLFKMVDIRYEHLAVPDPLVGSGGVATAFSGGVDSFYTLWAHMPENQPIPDARVTHGLFVHGLDLRLDDRSNYDSVANSYVDLFQSLGLELILASTNAYQLSEFRIAWTLIFGPPLIGAALLMSPLLNRFYVPSGLPYNGLLPHGSSPLTDHLLSTETLNIITRIQFDVNIPDPIFESRNLER